MLTAFNYIAEQVFGRDGNVDGGASVVRANKRRLSDDDTTLSSGDEITIFSEDETTIFSGDETLLSSIDETQTSRDDDDTSMRAMHEQKEERSDMLLPPRAKMPNAPLIHDGFDLTREDSLVARLPNDDDASVYVTIENGNNADDAISVCSGITCGGSLVTAKTEVAPGDGCASATTNITCTTTAGGINSVCVADTEEKIETLFSEDETTTFSTDKSRLSSIGETQTSRDDGDMRAMHKQKDERPNLLLLPQAKIPTPFSTDESRLSSIGETQTSRDGGDMRAMHKQKDERPNLLLLPQAKIPTTSLVQDDFSSKREDSLVASLIDDDDESVYVNYTVENGNNADDAISVCSGITCGGSVVTVSTATCESDAADDGIDTDSTNVAAAAEGTNFECVQNTEEEIEHMLKEAMTAMLRSYAYCNDAEDAGSVATKTDRNTIFTPNSSVSKLFANSTSAETLNEDEAMGNTAVKDRYTHYNPGEDPSKRRGPIKPTSDREDYFLSNPSMESAASALYAEIEPAVKDIKKIKEAKKEVDPDTTTQDLNPNVSSIRQTMVDVKEQGLVQVINNTLFGSTEAIEEIVDVLEEKGLFKSAARLLTFLDEDAQKRFTQQVIPDLGEVGLLNTMTHIVVDSCCCRIEQDILDEQEESASVAELALSTQCSSGGTCTKKSNLSEGASETVPECSAPVANAFQYSPDPTKKSDLSRDACDSALKEWHPSIEIIYNPGRKARTEEKRGKVALRQEDSLAVSSNSNSIRYRIPISTGVAVGTTSDSIENSDTANDASIVSDTDDGFEVMEKGRRNKTRRAVPMIRNASMLLTKVANKASSTTIDNNKECMNDGGDGKADALVRKRKEEQKKAAKLAEENATARSNQAEELKAAKEQRKLQRKAERRAAALAEAEAKAALRRSLAEKKAKEEEERHAAALAEAEAKRIEAEAAKAAKVKRKEKQRQRKAQLKQSLFRQAKISGESEECNQGVLLVPNEDSVEIVSETRQSEVQEERDHTPSPAPPLVKAEVEEGEKKTTSVDKSIITNVKDADTEKTILRIKELLKETYSTQMLEQDFKHRSAVVLEQYKGREQLLIAALEKKKVLAQLTSSSPVRGGPNQDKSEMMTCNNLSLVFDIISY